MWPDDDKSIDYDAILEQEMHYINVSFALSCIVLAFSILGAVTNFISIIVYSHPAMRSSINVLLTGLSVIDMCLCISAVPTFVIPPVCLYTSDLLEENSNNVFCVLTKYSTLYIYPLTTMTQTCSVWTFVVITFERWIAVCRPFRARWASTGRSLRALAIVCVFAAAYNFVRFFEHQPTSPLTTSASRLANASELGNQTAPLEQANLVEELLRKDEYYMKIYYSGLYLVTHFLVPFSVLAGVNGKMIFSIHRARQQRRMLSHSEEKEHRTAVMMGAVVLMFVCSNSLTFVLNFIEQVDRRLFTYPSTKILMFTLNDVSNLLVLINAAATIGFYYACSQKYRQLLHYYVVNFWCAACASFACPNNFEERRSRLRATSKMDFSFHSAFYGHTANDGLDHAGRGLSSNCSSRRGSGVTVERNNCGSGHLAHRPGDLLLCLDERKSLIPYREHSDPSRTRSDLNRRWSATALTTPLDRDHLAVPLAHKPTAQVDIVSQHRCSTLSIRSGH